MEVDNIVQKLTRDSQAAHFCRAISEGQYDANSLYCGGTIKTMPTNCPWRWESSSSPPWRPYSDLVR